MARIYKNKNNRTFIEGLNDFNPEQLSYEVEGDIVFIKLISSKKIIFSSNYKKIEKENGSLLIQDELYSYLKNITTSTKTDFLAYYILSKS